MPERERHGCTMRSIFEHKVRCALHGPMTPVEATRSCGVKQSVKALEANFAFHTSFALQTIGEIQALPSHLLSAGPHLEHHRPQYNVNTTKGTFVGHAALSILDEPR